MRPFHFLASSAVLCVVLLPLVTPSCGVSTTTPPTETGAGSGGSAATTGTGTAGAGIAGGAGTTQQGGAAGTGMTATDICVVDDDCVWGEIPSEILQSTDCVCLYGCVYLPQTKVTAARRLDQYKALCNPATNGKGQPCGIDDCASPGSIACVDGTCKAAPRDGGTPQ
jgi:hypothetical protein